MRATLLALLLMTSASLVSFAAHADVEIDGVRYANPIKVEGWPMQLTGAATKLNKLGARNFSVAIYAEKKAGSVDAMLGMRGSKRIAYKFLRPVMADGMRFLTKGVEANLNRADFVKSLNGLGRLGALLGSHPTFADGDTFTMDYQPGVGTFFAINGKRDPEPVKEPEFFKAMVLIWVGASPVDEKMKAGILGAWTNPNVNWNP